MDTIEVTAGDASALKLLAGTPTLNISARTAGRLINAQLAWLDPSPRGRLHISSMGRKALRDWEASQPAEPTQIS